MKNAFLRFKLFGAALVLSALCLGSAQASLITLNYNFTASGFDMGAPYDPVTGTFSVTFDNSADIFDSAAILASISIPIALNSIHFSYDQSLDQFILGGALNGADDAFSGTDDFLFVMSGASTGMLTAGAGDFVYTRASAPQVGFFARTVTLTQNVPDEASTLGLLAVALAGLVAVRQLRRPATA